MKNSSSKIIISVFLVLVFAFTGLSVFGKKTDISLTERRRLQTLPAVSLSKIGDGSFQREYQDYLSDQFEFRDFWRKAQTLTLHTLGKKDIDDIYFGRDGYLFEKYTADSFEPETVEYNIETLSAFLNSYADEGYNVSCAFVPSKHEILKNKLPRFASPFDTSVAPKEVKSRLTDDVTYVDLSEVLKAHSDEYIYYKTDHHWTTLGAYYAYKAIAEANYKSDIPELDEMESTVVCSNFRGSDSEKLQLNSRTDEITTYETGTKVKVSFNGDRADSNSLYAPEMLESEAQYEYFLGGNYARVDIETDTKNGETLLLIKDSFCNSLVPFLTRHYEKIIMLDLRYFSGDIEEIFDLEDIYDIMVIYNTEKFLVDENQSYLEAYEEHEMTEEELENERILAELEEEEREAGIID